MIARCRPLAVLRALALWAALLPVVLLSLLPVQAMPGRAADGTLTMVLCTGAGPVETLIDLATGQPVAETHERCAWNAAHVAAVLAGLPAAPAPRSATRQHGAARAPRTVALDAVPAPRTRGPPAPV